MHQLSGCHWTLPDDLVNKTSYNKNWNCLYFQASPPSHSISCVLSCRPFVVCTSLIWTLAVIWPGRATEDTSTPNNTCRRCRNNERPTGKNATNWKGRRWSLKIKVIPVLIAGYVYPSTEWSSLGLWLQSESCIACLSSSSSSV